VIGVIIAMMSIQGAANIQQQWGIRGEFSNVELEGLVDWINANTQNGQGGGRFLFVVDFVLFYYSLCKFVQYSVSSSLDNGTMLTANPRTTHLRIYA